jgi:hypothetical protein
MRRMANFPGLIFFSVFFSIFAGAAFLGAAASGQTAAAHKSPPDVYLITIDTLRADHVGCYGYKQIETPALDELAGC